MQELLKKLFQKRNIPATDEQIQRFAGEFAGIIFLHILGAAEKKFAPEDSAKFIQLLKTKEYEAIVSLIKQKYSQEELDMLVEKHSLALFDSYIVKLAIVKNDKS